MNFLELCQKVAQESGTVSDLTAPATVTGQTGRLLRIVNWTAQAYEDIQTQRDDWRWLHGEFSGQTIASTQRYDSAAMSISSRFSHWIFETEDDDPSFSIYKTSEGQDEEAFLVSLPWDLFRRKYLHGSAASETDKPAYVAVDPQDKLAFYPTPDAAYTVRGVYYKAPQELSADADIPEMPAKHHMAIVWRALILMGTHDEAADQVPVWAQFYAQHFAGLLRTQTPRIQVAGPIA